MKIFYQTFVLAVGIGSFGLNGWAAVLPEGAKAFNGEKLKYSIKKHGMKVGEATLVFNASDKLNGRDVYSIAFTSTSFNFLDEEMIYMDPATFLPLVVKRNLNIWGKKERINEEYLTQEGKVRITKWAGGKSSGQTIEKQGQLDNLYCFIYRFRLAGDVKPGSSLVLNLPTKDFKINVLKKTSLKIGDKAFDSYYLQSDSKEYKIWLEANEKKVPLRIDGALGIGSVSLIIADR